jgi:hypothetical protein
MKLKLAVLTLVVVAVVGSLFQLSRTSMAQSRVSWEYKVEARRLGVPGVTPLDLNSLGAQGWELVTVNIEELPTTGGAMQLTRIYHFKRIH